MAGVGPAVPAGRAMPAGRAVRAAGVGCVVPPAGADRAAAGSGLLWLVAEGYFRIRGREGMGLGDVKMMAAVGAFLGLKRTMMTVLMGSLLGSVIGIALIAISKKGRDYELPFGTFLGAGALLVVFFGTPALHWYESLLAVK